MEKGTCVILSDGKVGRVVDVYTGERLMLTVACGGRYERATAGSVQPISRQEYRAANRQFYRIVNRPRMVSS